MGSVSPRRPRAPAYLCALALTPALGCFVGTFAAGRPCLDDADCGPQLSCQSGYCDGRVPAGSTGETETSTGGETSADATTTTGAPATTTGTTGDGLLCEKMDVVLVLDNSDSMNQWDGRLFALASQFETYVGALTDDVGSVHFGVLGIDPASEREESCQVHGALRVDVSQGPLCAAHAQRPYLTDQDTFDVLNLGCFIRPPSGSPDEQPMRSLLAATDWAMNAEGGCNEGFIRDDALLVVLLFTDEDDDHGDLQGHDGSPGDPQFWYEKLLYYKRGNADAIVVGALLGEDPLDSGCPWVLPEDKSEVTQSTVQSIGAEEGVRIRKFLDQLPVGHAYVSSVCEDSYVDFFVQFFEEIVRDACEDHDPLATDPFVMDPTDGDDTGAPEPDAPQPGAACDPDGPLGQDLYCRTDGYGALGELLECVESEPDEWTWEAALSSCEEPCAKLGGIASGCSGNGVAPAWGCVCALELPCDPPSGCMGDFAMLCLDDALSVAECADSCLDDPRGQLGPVCGPTPP
ncbi:MAG: hypothetical protein H6713_33000 [Myxococcales bacterium]|nr:hypothetical protein [Myxococcales bacterium]